MQTPISVGRSITFSTPIALQTDTEMLEGFCENHHKSRERMVSTKAADVAQVPAATPSRYVGTYDTTNDGRNHFVQVAQEGTNLWFDYGAIVEFSTAASGMMNITIHYVESTELGSRRK